MIGIVCVLIGLGGIHTKIFTKSVTSQTKLTDDIRMSLQINAIFRVPHDYLKCYTLKCRLDNFIILPSLVEPEDALGAQEFLRDAES